MRRWLGLVVIGLLSLGLMVLLAVLGLTRHGEGLGSLADRMQVLESPTAVVLGLATVPVWKKVIDDWSEVRGPLLDALWPKEGWSIRRRVMTFGSPALAVAVTLSLVVVLAHGAPKRDTTPPENGGCPKIDAVTDAGNSTCVMKVHDRSDERIGYLGTLPRDGVVFSDKDKLAQSVQTPAQQAEDRRFHDDQVRILRANVKATTVAEETAPRRPVVSLVYFAGLTTALNDDYDSAEAEELEGLYLAQKDQNEIGRDGPVLKLVIANGGAHMTWADFVARQMLVPLYRRDPSVLGVVGLDRSTSVTQAATALLDDAGIPTVGTTLSADDFAERPGGGGLTYYRHLSALNEQEADLIAEYIRRVVPAYFRFRKDLYNSDGKARPERLTIYQPPPDPTDPRPGDRDLYLQTLVADLRDHFDGKGGGLTVSEPTQRLNKDLCGASSVVIYAGRHDRGDFSKFLDQMEICRGEKVVTGKLPFVIADDGITRFVADPDKRDAKYKDIEISYVTKGVDVLRTGRSCVTPNARRDPFTRLGALCAGYAGLVNDPQWFRRARPLWMGERVALAYEAAGLFVSATANGAVSQAAVRESVRKADYRSRPLAIVRIPMDSKTSRPGCEYDASDHALGGAGRLNGTGAHPCPVLG